MYSAIIILCLIALVLPLMWLSVFFRINLAIHDFSTRVTNDIFFSIKPLDSPNFAFIPFLIRTHWRYTAWTKIGFSFLAEDRRDLESGYYQVDTKELGGCQPGKNIQLMLPFKQQNFGFGPIQHSLFLHGFEISAQQYNETNLSPF